MHTLFHTLLFVLMAAVLVLAPTGAVGSVSQPSVCPVVAVPTLQYPMDRELIYFDPNGGVETNLEWTSVTNATAYQVEVTKPNTDIVTQTTNANLWSFPDIDQGFHRWRVRALNITGCPASAWTGYWTYDLQYFPPPAIPINVHASDGVYTDHVHITWDDGPFNGWHPESYRVYRSETEYDHYIWINDWDWFNKTWDDTTAIPGKTYYYSISACNHIYECSSLSYPSETGYTAGPTPLLFPSLWLPSISK